MQAQDGDSLNKPTEVKKKEGDNMKENGNWVLLEG